MDDKNKALLSDLDNLIKEIEGSDEILPKEVDKIINEVVHTVNVITEKKKREPVENLGKKLDQLIQVITDNKDLSKKTTENTISAIKNIKIQASKVNVAPPKVEVNVPPVKPPVVKIPETKIEIPDEVKDKKPSWLPTLQPITSLLKGIEKSIDNFGFPIVN